MSQYIDNSDQDPQFLSYGDIVREPKSRYQNFTRGIILSGFVTLQQYDLLSRNALLR